MKKKLLNGTLDVIFIFSSMTTTIWRLALILWFVNLVETIASITIYINIRNNDLFLIF